MSSEVELGFVIMMMTLMVVRRHSEGFCVAQAS
jgi:hypothetical protein